jgi:hypothetical protein
VRLQNLAYNELTDRSAAEKRQNDDTEVQRGENDCRSQPSDDHWERSIMRRTSLRWGQRVILMGFEIKILQIHSG